MTPHLDGRPIAGIIFDKDGTLFDFNATWGAWARDVLVAETQADTARLAALCEAMGYDFEAGVFRPGSVVIAGTVDEIANAALPYLTAASIDEVITRFNDAAAAAPQVEATPLQPFLARLRAAGLSLGVATNDGEAPARAHLGAASVETAFDFIAGYDSGYGGKPAPGQLLGFCHACEIDPTHCVMVGDSLHDLDAAGAAGMARVAVLTGPAPHEELAPHADYILPSIAGLLALLGLDDGRSH